MKNSRIIHLMTFLQTLPRILATLICVMYAVPAFTNDSCSDVLRDGTHQTVIQKFHSVFETLDIRQFSQSSSGATDTSGSYGAYQGSRSENHKSALADSRFGWLYEVNDLEYASTTGDKEIIGAWATCIEKNGGGPLVWFDATDNDNIVLHIEFVPPKHGDIRKMTITSDVDITPSIKFVDANKCLVKGTKIGTEGCLVKIRGLQPAQTVVAAVNNDFHAIDAHLARRTVLKLETKHVANLPLKIPGPSGLGDVLGVGAGDAASLTNQSKFDVPVEDGWHYDDDANETPNINGFVTSSSANNIVCQGRTEGHGKDYFTADVYATSYGDTGGSCGYTVSFSEFRFVEVPR